MAVSFKSRLFTRLFFIVFASSPLFMSEAAFSVQGKCVSSVCFDGYTGCGCGPGSEACCAARARRSSGSSGGGVSPQQQLMMNAVQGMIQGLFAPEPPEDPAVLAERRRQADR
ncbi:MAG TPA: hypothetical protein VJB59_04295 [Bdellovibrionota bacterium]|nr:hypothetical protein [Bdellovibrionota bacterium]